MIHASISNRGKVFFLFQNVQTGFWGFFCICKAARASLSSDKVKNVWSLPLPSLYAIKVCRVRSLMITMSCRLYHIKVTRASKRLRWSRGSVLAFGTQVLGFKPGRTRLIFQDEKNLSTPSFGKGSKAVCPTSHICGM